MASMASLRTMRGTPRSEQDREVAQARWYGLVRRLLSQHAMSANLRLPLSRPTTCNHPQHMVVNGSNRYGRWTRCNACKQQLTYEPYSESNPPTKNKPKQIKHQETFLPQPKILPAPKERKQKPEAVGGVSLERQAGYLVSGQAALGPLVQNQAQLQQALQQAMSHQQMAAGSASQMPSAHSAGLEATRRWRTPTDRVGNGLRVGATSSFTQH